MMKIWALVKNGIVQNKIVADNDFINLIKPDYDHIVELKDNHPNIGDGYSNGEFDSPHEIIHIDVNPDQDHLKIPTKTFEPFILPESGHKVSLSGNYLNIGCKRYNILYARDTFHKILNGIKEQSGVLSKSDKGVKHGQFEISKEEMKQILEKLC